MAQPFGQSILNRDFQVFLYRMSKDQVVRPGDGAVRNPFVDPMDYVAPDNLAWDRYTQDIYRTDFYKAAIDMRKRIVGAIKYDLVTLVPGPDSHVQVQDIERQLGYSPLPLIKADLTPYVVGIEEFKVDLAFNNSVNIAIELDTSLSEGPHSPKDSFLGLREIQENDLIEIRVKFDDDVMYRTEFIGFATNISDVFVYGAVRKIMFSAFGIQKMLSLTKIVTQPLPGELRLMSGLEINAKDYTGFATSYQNLNTGEVFNKVMADVMCYRTDYYDASEVLSRVSLFGEYIRVSAKTHPTGQGVYEDVKKQLDAEEGLSKRIESNDPGTVESLVKISRLSQAVDFLDGRTHGPTWDAVRKQIGGLEDEKGKSSGQIVADLSKVLEIVRALKLASDKDVSGGARVGFEFDVDRLTGLQDFKVSFLTMYSFYKLRILLDRSYRSQAPELREAGINLADELDLLTFAFFEGASHVAFNAMVASYDGFFSQLTPPIEILNHLRDTLYYDVFANRLGTIICRPAKYNDVFPDPEIPEANIIERADWLRMTLGREDTSLKTHVDTQFVLPIVGIMNFPTGSYTDFNILFNYGMRLDSPISNPNVRVPTMGGLFSALELNVKNAGTRTISMSAKSNRFRIGELYVIKMTDSYSGQSAPSPLESSSEEALVGYLTSIQTTIQYGKSSTQSLLFAYVRRFNFPELGMADSADHPDIREALRAYDYRINGAASMGRIGADAREKFQAQAADLARRQALHAALVQQGLFYKSEGVGRVGDFNAGDRIRTMKRLPSIRDIQQMLEVNPSLGTGSESGEVVSYGAYDKRGIDRNSWATFAGDFYVAEDPSPDVVNAYIRDGFDAVRGIGRYRGRYPDNEIPALDNYNKLREDQIAARLPKYGEHASYTYNPNVTGDGVTADPGKPQYITEAFSSFHGLNVHETGDVSRPQYICTVTPFNKQLLKTSEAITGVMQKRMIKSLFGIDMMMKQAFYQFHDTHGTLIEDTPSSSIFGAYCTHILMGRYSRTMLPVSASPIGVGSHSGAIYTFNNDYFSAGDPYTGALPSGTLVIIATWFPTRIKKKVSIASGDQVEIIPGVRATIYINHLDGTSTQETQCPEDVLYFISPSMEFNMEKFQQAGLLWRGVMDSDAVPVAYKTGAYGEKDVPVAHIEGRAMDIVYYGSGFPLFPGVIDGSHSYLTIMPNCKDKMEQIFKDHCDGWKIHTAANVQIANSTVTNSMTYMHIQVNGIWKDWRDGLSSPFPTANHELA